MEEKIKIVPRYRVDELNEKVKYKPKRSNKKKTTEEYKKELEIKNPNVEVLGEYINAKTKIEMLCKIHNIKYFQYPDNALRGYSGCKYCKSKHHSDSSVQDTNTYLKKLLNLNSTIRPKEKYKGTNTSIVHYCTLCGHEWNITPSSLLRYEGKCSNCINIERKRKNFLEYKKRLFDTNRNIICISKYYIDSQTPIEHLCLICSNIWRSRPASISYGFGCPRCGSKNSGNLKRKTKETYENELLLLGNKIKLKGDYVTALLPTEHKCNICEYEWLASPNNILHGYGCPRCSGRVKTHEDFIKEIEIINPFIKIIGIYQSASDRIECKCLICDFVWNQTPTSLLCGSGCPSCHMTHLERYTYKYLLDNNISFIYQEKFDGLIGIGRRKLSYDFYLPQYNLLIECQGEQHERPIEYFGGEKQFKIQLEHDRRKREYATMHNINLLEIWYYDIDNIEEILTNILNNLKLESVTTTGVA